MKNWLVTFEVSCPDGLLAIIRVSMKAGSAKTAVKAANMLVAKLAVFKSVVEVVKRKAL